MDERTAATVQHVAEEHPRGIRRGQVRRADHEPQLVRGRVLEALPLPKPGAVDHNVRDTMAPADERFKFCNIRRQRGVAGFVARVRPDRLCQGGQTILGTCRQDDCPSAATEFLGGGCADST